MPYDQNTNGERSPPQDLGAERAVLGALLSPEGLLAWDRVVKTGLQAGDFYRTDNSEIFRRIAFFCVQGRNPDPPLLVDWLHGPLKRDRDEVLGYLLDLASSSPTVANTDWLAEKIRAASVRRSTIRLSTSLIRRSYEFDAEDTVGELIAGALEDFREIQDYTAGANLFPTQTGAQFLEVDPGPRPLLVGSEVFAKEEWLLLIGEPKTGKSMLALDLAVALITDQDREPIWSGFTVFPERRVLYLVGEGGRRNFYGRFSKRTRGLSREEVERFHIWFPSPELLSIERAEEFSILRNYVVENGIELVILDPLAHFHNLDENSNSEMKQVAARFLSLKESTGAGLLVVHHKRKSSITSRKGSALEARGASSLWGAADGAVVFENEDTDDERNADRRMTFSLRNAEEEPEPRLVELDKETLRFRLVTANLGGRPVTHDVDVPEIIEYLDANPGSSYREISAGLGVPERTLQRWLPDLKRHGRVTRERHGTREPYRWYLPAGGTETAATETPEERLIP